MSAPEAAWARAISGKLRYLPVPTINRDLNARPAITRSSDIGIPIEILALPGPGDKSEERQSRKKHLKPRRRRANFTSWRKNRRNSAFQNPAARYRLSHGNYLQLTLAHASLKCTASSDACRLPASNLTSDARLDFHNVME